jgi:hypothetical protein
MLQRIIFASITIFFFGLYACNESAPNETDTDNQTEALSQAEKEQYLAKGKSIAQASFEALSGQLKAAMQEGGVPNAVSYCNLVAYPLTDSLSNVHKATIRRTSEKIRNPKNAPSVAELAVLKEYAQQAASGQELKPGVDLIDAQTVAFYAPIKTQGLCLSCHGTPGETILDADYALIKELYPSDQAVGYQADQLRGMWSIQFEREVPAEKMEN